jgi:hypothetical protein
LRRSDGLAARALDLALTPVAAAAGLVLKALARIDARMPNALRALDASGLRVVRRHYYSPLIGESDLHRPLEADRPLPGLDLNEAGQLALLAEFDFADELKALPERETPGRYHYHNGSYEWGDGEFLYDMIRRFRPRRIVEVGAGNSTRMAAEAIAANRTRDPAYACRHLCIEPFEQPWLEALGVEVLREKVERVDPAVFAALEAGDILLIDSSHVIRPQGDVLAEYLEILPALAPGVLVQVHDIFTPRDYPRQWLIDERRLWDEQYLLEAFLSFNREFEVIAAVNWLSHHHRDKLERAAPMLLTQPGHEPGAFWIRRR